MNSPKISGLFPPRRDERESDFHDLAIAAESDREQHSFEINQEIDELKNETQKRKEKPMTIESIAHRQARFLKLINKRREGQFHQFGVEQYEF
jgi:hypothetical protein